MSRYSWKDEKLQYLCAKCHLKDDDPDLCHAVEPPLVKTSIPSPDMNALDLMGCGFVRESQWQRMPQEQKDRILEEIKERSKHYYKTN